MGLSGRAIIHWGNFWRKNLSRYDLITVFQVGFVMGRLEAKLRRELPAGARIVSHYWRFPGLRPERVQGNITGIVSNSRSGRSASGARPPGRSHFPPLRSAARSGMEMIFPIAAPRVERKKR